jgi:hypothetical protein
MADRYWVGGSGTWDASTTTNWATTSGGAGGASAPTSADNAYFDGSSDSGAPFTVTIGTGAVCEDIIVGDGVIVTTLDQAMTLAGTAAWTISGAIYFPATSFTRTYSGNITLNTSGTKDITLNGIILTNDGTVTFNASGTYNFQSAATLTTLTKSVFLRRVGTLNTNNYNITAASFLRDFSQGATVLNLGSSIVTCTHTNLSWTIETSAGLTINAGTSTIALTSASTSENNAFGSGLTYNNVSISSNSFTFLPNTALNDNCTFNNFTFSSSSISVAFVGAHNFTNFNFARRGTAGTSSITFTANQTITGALNIQSGYGATFDITDTAGAITAATVNAGGTGYNVGDVINVTGGNNDAQLTVATLSGSAVATVTISTAGTGYTTATGVATTLATSALNPNRRVLIASNTIGTARTITAAAVNITNADFRNITGAGAATWNDSSRARYWGNGLGNSGITFSAGVSKYRIGTGNWSATQWAASSGGSPAVGDFPLVQDTCVFDANTATGTYTLDVSFLLGSLSMSAVTSAITLATGGLSPSIYGNVTLDADVTLSGTGTLGFAGQGTTQTITSAGRTFTQSITVSSPTGTVAIADALTTNSTFTLTQGTLDITNQTLSCGSFVSNNTSTRSIAFGTTGKIVLTGVSGNLWQATSANNMTFTGTSRVELSNASPGTRQLLHGGAGGATENNSPNIYITLGDGSLELTNATSWGTVDFGTSSATWLTSLHSNNFYGDLVLSSGTTVNSSTGTRTFRKSSGSQSITSNGKTLDFPIAKSDAGTLTLADNLTMGSTRTFTLTQGTLALNDKTLTTGLFSSSNSNVREINFGSSGELRVLEGATSFNAATGTNLTTSGTGTINMVNAAGKTFVGGGRTYPTLNQGGTSQLLITGANTFADISNVRDSYGDTQRYNLLTYSEEFDNASAWTLTNSSISASSVNAPFGGGTMQKLVENNATGVHRVFTNAANQYAGIGGETVVYSVYLQASERTFAHVSSNYSDRAQDRVAVNLTTGQVSVVVGSVLTASAQAVGNGIWRIVITQTKASSAQKSFWVETAIGMASGDNSYTGDGTSGIYIWGAQLVTGPYPGVYQKVEAASVFTPQADAFPVAITFPSGVTTSVQDFSVGGTLGNLVTLNASTPGSRAILNRV